MSEGSRRCRSQARRHLCAGCRERRARFQYRGEVRADRHHVLCFQCFRSVQERLRAWQVREDLPWGQEGPYLRSSAEAESIRPALTDREVEHRRTMLAYMERQAASG